MSTNDPRTAIHLVWHASNQDRLHFSKRRVCQWFTKRARGPIKAFSVDWNVVGVAGIEHDPLSLSPAI